MKKYCVKCIRWFGTLKEVKDKCPIHPNIPDEYFVGLKELKREFKSKIISLKMRKEKVNEELEFHKETLKIINRGYNV